MSPDEATRKAALDDVSHELEHQPKRSDEPGTDESKAKRAQAEEKITKTEHPSTISEP